MHAEEILRPQQALEILQHSCHQQGFSVVEKDAGIITA